jgi:hypothetical protein
MKKPRVTISEARKRFDGIDRFLCLVFKVGMPLGAVVLIFGSIAVGEAILSISAASFAAVAVLRGYIECRWSARSARVAINLAITHGFAAILLGSVAVVLGVIAVRSFLRI